MKAKLLIVGLTLICFLLLFGAVSISNAQQTTVSIVPSQNSLRIGETLTVNVTISNVQNLYGLDVTVNWNSSALEILNTNSRLGIESNPDGVLHETASYPLEIAENSTSQSEGQYHIVATSQGDAAPFSGSGTIAILTFNVTSTGHSSIDVISELADHPEPGDTTSEPIAHVDIGSSVDAAIPEFPQIALIGALIAVVTVAALLSKRKAKKQEHRTN